MTNHVHLLVTPRQEWAASKMMKDLGQHYVQDFNRSNRRTGTLWEGRFRSSVVDSQQYLFTLHRYIELNPVRASMVVHPSQYEWSSYRANALGERSQLITPHPLYLALADDDASRRRAYSDMFGADLLEHELTAIRQAVLGGRALGAPPHSWGLNASVGLSPSRLRRPRTRATAD